MINLDYVNFRTNEESFKNDYQDIIRAFSPFTVFQENGILIELSLINTLDNEYNTIIEIDNNCLMHYEKQFKLEEYSTEIERKSLKKRYSKIFLYEILSKLLSRKLPYGSLTGIRPTKLFHDLTSKGIDASDYFKNVLFVSDEKVKLIETICKNQTNIYNKNEKEIDVFVNIPICISRCSYCSFISAELDKVKKLVTPYTDLLLKEIETTKQIINREGLIVRSVYVGGGTPTSIDDENFYRIISSLNFNASEFTVEAGRPDTISENKLKIMDKCGVTRISINPQSFNQKTLDLIGRKHTVDEIYKVYEMARRFSFDINMDLIAMLPNETFEDFKYSVNQTLKLNPENITIHTLALKRGSKLHESNYDNTSDSLPSKMVDYAMKSMLENGYEPYYMYKQKHVSGNLENVGYCKKDKACIYTVDIMEETTSIIANGAGAISKRLFLKDNRLERLANPKGLDVYLQREDALLKDKDNFFFNI